VALTDVDRCEREPDLAHHINAELAHNVAQACGRLGIKLVHSSTDHLFDGKKAFCTELDAVCPVNIYGKTKAQAEDLVFGACPEALVVRTNFYGWGPPYRQSFSDWIIQGLNAGQPLNLFGDVFYTPILIDSLVQHSHELIRLDASGIFNIVGNERVSKYEFGIAVAKCFGLNADLINLTSMADRQSLVMRPLDMSLSSRKAGKIITHKMNRLSEDIQNLFLKK
jgi:dTDP-4-dehydrorhamnose reductase